ncbi:MAG TPA: ABC transporter permease [Streptosporangiaceae bacterium]|nr:ABC transporter permease [Streptosporangiaceae bacterium]
MTTALPGTDPTRSAAAAGGAAERTQPTAAGTLRRAAATFSESKLALAGLVILVVVAGLCFIGPLFYHSDTLATRLYQTNLPPGAGHPLGTDDSGRDILGRLMLGGQSSLEIGIAVALIATTFGALWGALAGYVGGPLDAAMMRCVDAMLALPGIFLFLYLASIFQPNLLLIIIVLSVFSWLVPGRLVRGEVLSLRTRDYVQAVRQMGGRGPRIVVRHLLPNTIGTIVVNGTFQVADAILALALLSYLGFGLQPPAPTWGGMLSAGINYVYDGYWWQVYPAGLAIVLTVVAINLIGDSLRDALEVRLQSR